MHISIAHCWKSFQRNNLRDNQLFIQKARNLLKVTIILRAE